MYKIIGANQVEYGPISADQIRQWIAEGRINAQTSAQAVGDATWKPISSFPEFASLFAGTPPQAGPAPFTGTPPQPGPISSAPAISEAGRAKALSDINGPAIALLVLAILSGCYSLFGIVMNAAGGNAAQLRRLHEMGIGRQNPELEKFIQMSGGITGVITGVIDLAAAVFIIMAALKMKKLEGHTMAMIASILTIIPCIVPCPCCCFGIPIGIWALIVLNRPEVRGYFTK